MHTPDDIRHWSAAHWRAHLDAYCKSHNGEAIWQLVVTLLGVLGLWVLGHSALQVSPLLSLPVSCVAGGFMIRAFIIQHDCGHLAYFSSRRANFVVGRIVSVLTLIPFDHWRRLHALHHAHSGNLEGRGTGDIDMLTVAEYQALPFWQRLAYRFYRHPLVLLGIGPFYYFVLKQRSPFGHPLPWQRGWRSVMGTNLALFALWGSLIAVYGWSVFLWLYLPTVLSAGAIGVYLFYVQHQYPEAYWRRGDEWTFTESALAGSSYLKLPRFLHWITGNIAYHHVHHLCSRIPSYRLPECLRAEPILQNASALSLWQSFKTLRLALWDEARECMVPFSSLGRPARSY